MSVYLSCTVNTNTNTAKHKHKHKHFLLQISFSIIYESEHICFK